MMTKCVDHNLLPDDPYIIAEAGSNHNGSVARALELVTAASESGANSIKFQFIYADGLYLPAYRDGEKIIPNPVYDQRKSEELTDDAWSEIWQFALGKGIDVSASVFDERGLALLNALKAPYIKIASTDLNNTPFLERVAATDAIVILSTGMATLSEIEQAVDVFRKNNRDDKLIILHCVSMYPCDLGMANIGTIDVLKAAFGLPVGYSDHTTGALAACLAITQGATIIEKHFTTDKSLPGFDHKHALDPFELRKFVEDIRASKQAMAVNGGRRNDGEGVTKVRARRGLYAARDLPEGHTLTAEDILVVRPASELAPGQLSELIGQPLKKPVYQYEPFGLHCSVSAGSSNWQAANSYWVGEMKEKGMVPK